MKLHTVYSDSHIGLYRDHLLPSCGWAEAVVAVYVPQDCPTGVYRTAGWDLAMRRKCRVIVDAIEAGRVFAFADPDVTFFGDPSGRFDAALDGVEIAFQRDDAGGSACAGLFVCRPTQAMHDFWREIEASLTRDCDDQGCANARLATVTHRLMGPEFTNLGVLDGRTWDGRDDTPEVVELPDPMLSFHANFARGPADKDKLLRTIRRRWGHRAGRDASKRSTAPVRFRHPLRLPITVSGRRDRGRGRG